MLVMPRSKFLKVKCPQCKNEQIIYNKPATEVKCLVCGKTLMKPTGGKGKLLARVMEIYG